MLLLFFKKKKYYSQRNEKKKKICWQSTSLQWPICENFRIRKHHGKGFFIFERKSAVALQFFFFGMGKKPMAADIGVSTQFYFFLMICWLNSFFHSACFLDEKRFPPTFTRPVLYYLAKVMRFIFLSVFFFPTWQKKKSCADFYKLIYSFFFFNFYFCKKNKKAKQDDKKVFVRPKKSKPTALELSFFF